MNPEISERYKKIQCKFNLPQLDVLKDTFKFDIDSMEKEEDLFDNIRDEMFDRLIAFTDRIIEPLIGMTDSLSCMYEQNMLTLEEKKKLFELYRKIQALKWENNLLLIKHDEKKTAVWINKTWSLWNSDLEEGLTKISENLADKWSGFKFKEKVTNYHG
jgi:hypothetical protein